MKKTIQLTLILCSILLVFTNRSIAKGKEFKGIIIYEITYPNSDFDASTLAMLPKTLKITIKGNKSKSEMKTAMGTQTGISNGDDQTAIILMDMMGQKIAVNSTTEEIEKELAEMPEPNIEYSNETKEIAGYSCKKAIITIKDKDTNEETVLNVYYTDELGSKELNFQNPIFKDINGAMLEYEIDANGMNMKFTAKEVQKKKISDKEFEIPEGYEIITQDELKSRFGGF
ncbi:MAG: hypothetical protein K8R58_14125 [Bacteroidales bacterium]|nr:hypothetical protein [Bacteroidales bacterium]